MTTLTLDSARTRVPPWLWGAASFGVAWNLYGLYRFAAGFTPSGRAALAAGLTPAQAEWYFALPAWISIVFAVGVIGGLLGSIALLLRRRLARRVLWASLAGYVLLFAGDLHHGLFDAIPAQMAVLSFVVLVAAVLLGVAWRADRRGLLR
jgi:hypothetical protein